MTEPEETSFTRVAFPAALGSFVLIGAIDAAYGPLLRPISQRFGESLPAAGTVISVNFAGALTGVLCVLAGFRRAPRRPIAPFALAAVGVGCLTIASARAWQVLNAGVFLTGVGFGATDFSLQHLDGGTGRRPAAGPCAPGCAGAVGTVHAGAADAGHAAAADTGHLPPARTETGNAIRRSCCCGTRLPDVRRL